MQPVSESSVREHLFMTRATATGRVPLVVEEDTAERELPRFLRLPGTKAFVDLGEPQVARPDDQPTQVAGETARRVWLLHPATELPLDSLARLVVEPGLEPAEGELRGDESRTVVELDVLQFSIPGRRLQRHARAAHGADGAEQWRDLQSARFGRPAILSSPVLRSEVKSHVAITPDLAGGRTDYDPWENQRDFTQLERPHRRGSAYTVWLPERLKAAEPYHVRVPDPGAGPKDEFGRPLTVPVNLDFATTHRPSSFTLVHTTAVLEQGVEPPGRRCTSRISIATLWTTAATTAAAPRRDVLGLLPQRWRASDGREPTHVSGSVVVGSMRRIVTFIVRSPKGVQRMR